MKNRNLFKKLLLFVAFLSPVLSYGKCAHTGLYFWPNKDSVKANSVFMLEGYAMSCKVISGLQSKYPVYLQSGNKKIALTIKDTLRSQYGLMQAILVPETKLEPGSVYTLKIDHLPEYERAFRWSDKQSKYVPVTFTAVAEEDTNAPEWKAAPAVKDKEIIHYGCGPGVNVIFSCEVKDDSPYLVRTTLTSKRTGETCVYYIAAEEKGLYVGHDMCSGAFNFSETDYTVSFDLMDASGNFRAWEGEKIAFTAPEEKNTK